MDQWRKVRHAVLNGNMPYMAACKEFKVSHYVLHKMLEHPEPPGYRMSQARQKSVLTTEFLEIINDILVADLKMPKKQRHTAVRIHERLKAEHEFQGCYTVVKKAVRDWHQTSQEVFVPLLQPPGEAQMDFGHALVRIAGVETTAHLCVLTLPHSDVIFVQAYPRECTETFIDGHLRAFAFFGGCPTKISYDNSKIPVKKIIGAHERELTDAFIRFNSHFMFTPHFCRVRCPNEKGHVENGVNTARHKFFVPMLEAASWDDLNRKLVELCRTQMDRICRGETLTKGERLEEDRKALKPLPAEGYEARRIESHNATSLSLVRFDRNDYSVPTAYAHHHLKVIGTVSEVRVATAEGEVVATHAGCWDKEKAIYNPVHYLALLEKKPGAFDFAKPLENFALPPCFEDLRRRMESGIPKGTREFIKVLRLLEKFTVAQLTEVVQYALDIRTIEADAIRVLLEHRQEKPLASVNLDGRPHLKLVNFGPPDLKAYQFLLSSNRNPSPSTPTPIFRFAAGGLS